MRWKQDARDLKTLNETAMRTAARIAHGIIVPASQPANTMAPQEDAGVMEKVAWELLEKVSPETKEDSWGPMAQGLLKVTSLATRILPRE